MSMSKNTSNRNGRALEYKVSLALAAIPNFSLTSRALADNQRDAPKFAELPTLLQARYTTGSQKIAEWAQQQIQGNVSIDRLADEAHDVTDIRLSSNQVELNLSVKHNHKALKHPRPYSFAQACGYEKGTAQDLEHRSAMDIIGKSFRAKAANKSLFRDCDDVVKKSLYLDVCNVCATSLQSWVLVDENVANNLFSFIVNTGFYKIIVETKPSLEVSIEDYSNMPAPSMVTTIANENRLILKFDNGWEINNRIHTASSKISAAGSQLSLKFDSQRTAGDITGIVLFHDNK